MDVFVSIGQIVMFRKSYKSICEVKWKQCLLLLLLLLLLCIGDD